MRHRYDHRAATQRPGAVSSCAAGARVGVRAAGTRVGRSAVDAGPGDDADRPAVPHLLHRGRRLAAAEPARLVLAAARPTGDRAPRYGGGAVEEGGLAAGKSTAAALDAWAVFQDEAGQSMTPPGQDPGAHWPHTGRAGSRPGLRPGVDGRMVSYKPGERSKLIYPVREYHGRKDEPKGFGWRDLRNLLVRARIQLGGPIVLVSGNIRLHRTASVREFIPRTHTGSPSSNCPPTRRTSTRRGASGHRSSARSATSLPLTSPRSPGPSSADSSRSSTAPI